MTEDQAAAKEAELAKAGRRPSDLQDVAPVPVAPTVGHQELGQDGQRRWGGFIAFFSALVVFVVAAWWTACSLNGPFDAATSLLGEHAKPLEAGKQAVVDPGLYSFLTKLHLAKVSFLATVAAFSIALLRYANILTMPLARYIQLEEMKSRKGDPGSIETLVRLIKDSNNQPKD